MSRVHTACLSSVSLAALALMAAPAAAQDTAGAEVTQEDLPAVIPAECAQLPPAEQAECAARIAGEVGEPALAGTEAGLPEGGAPAGEGTIIVTGSRIARPNFDTLQPSVIIDSEQIENRGFETLGQALNEQPSFGVPGASPVGAGQGGSFGSGQSFVNFLGLGDQRTLVLVNGRRFVSSNTASIFGPSNAGLQVDLNAINTRLVDRIETIAIGGAPIYGSDAIAGTINIILRDDYEGLELDAQHGIAEEGDAPNYRIRGIWGHNFGDGRGNVTVSGEYNKGEGLVYNDRDITAQGMFYRACRPEDNTGFNQCLFFNRRIPSISESGVLLVGGDIFGLDFPLSPDQQALIFGVPGFHFGVQDAQGNQLQFSPTGELIPIDFGRRVGAATSFNIDFEGGNGFNLFNTQQLLTDTERYSATLLAKYDITENIRLFAEGWYAFTSATNLREQPVYNSGLFDAAGTPDGNIIMSVNNPFLTEEQRQIIIDSINNNPFSDQNLGLVAVQDYFYYGRANTDLISGRASSETDVYRVVGGLDGSFGIGGREMNWELVGNYGRADTQGREPALVQQNFENAVNAVRDANGNIVCAPGGENAPIETLSPNCAPLNLFGSGLISDEARDYVTAIADPSSRNEQWVVTASVSGPLFSLPGGDLSAALGVEHRDESTAFDPGEFFFGGPDPDPTTDANNDGDPTNDRVQFGRSIPIFPVSGGYNTDEVFGELTADLVSPSNNVPLIHDLEIHGAARYVDHSTAGGDWTWTTEARWEPVSDLAFRGNYTRAIRAPAITEIFNPSSSFFTFATDPCDADNLNSGPDPATRQANCAAAGIPPTFQSLSAQRSFPGAIAGNVALENEKSRAWSIGVVATPRFIPNLRISADYLEIKLRDAISNFTATQVVSACYDSPDFPNNEFCERVRRDPANDQLNFVQTSFFNAAEIQYKGLLGALDYRTSTPFLGAGSQVGVNATYQYLATLETRATADSEPSQLDGELGYPHHSAVVNVNYENGPFLWWSSFNYTGEVVQEQDEPEDFRQFGKLEDVIFVNTGFAVNVNDRMRFRFVVDNLFDQDPPFPVPAFGGVVTYFPGILGRYYRVGASIAF
jgi:iron complex outermembrane receptor protein